MSVDLPGGLWVDGEISRHVEFLPLTGEVERAIAEPAESRPEWGTAVLCAAIARVGVTELTPQIAEQLAVGDRVYLIVQLGLRCAGDLVWRTPECSSCGYHFDVPVRPSQFELRSPAPGWYPEAEVRLGDHVISVRGPNGLDQSWLARVRPPDPMRTLAQRCVVTVDGKEPDPGFFAKLEREEEDALDRAIQSASPQVICTLDVRCPTCRHSQPLDFDPYWFTGDIEDALDRDVHILAAHYHWSQAEILALSRRQRRRYVAVIHEEQGLHA